MKMGLMEKIFVPRNIFDLSHDRKMDVDMGKLYPIMCEEVMPGDSFSVATEILARALPLVAPTYHDIDIKTRFFFVPTRLVWDEWEKFITGGDTGTSAPTAPHFADYPITKGELGDYFGLPVVGGNGIPWVSALPYRAYAKIYNDYFRDQWLQTEVAFSKASGTDATTNGSLLSVNWEKDYFTSSLPTAQKGNPVTIGLAGTAPVTIPGGAINASQLGVTVRDQTGGPFGDIQANANQSVTQPSTNNTVLALRGDTGTGGNLTGTADLSSATPITINDLRLATQIQRFLERMARAGSRYIEYILNMFGVQSQDARLQRAEYLGGGVSKLIISEVLQTSETDTTPQGSLAGHGFSLQLSKEFRKGFTEHGFVIGLMYIIPRTQYAQGLSRMWTRTTKWDYYNPLLAHIGEQAVLNKEVYCDPTDGHDDDVWGFQGRGDEYRRRESSVHNDFRNVTGLGVWTLTRHFASRPSLNTSFLACDASKRIFADTNDPGFVIYLKNKVTAIRPMPKVATPGYMDH